ncbi:MAG: hypothetical protein DWI01_00820 [Planctomycetota bacterium]|nr:MAG: hypothetical protein DWI01_00820 [Planctomycetota bacterium]
MPPRLLLVTVDRLPAWIVPAWGATWVSAPALDALAGRGVVFDRLIAPSLDPGQTLDALGGALVTAAARAGLRPTLVTDDAAFAARWAAEGEGVELSVTVVPALVPRRLARRAEETNLGRLFAAARGLLAGGEESIVWVHAGSLGLAWDAPESFREPYLDPDDPPPPEGVAVPSLRIDADTDPDLVMGHRQRLAAQVSLLDRCLGELVAALSAPPLSAEAWTICFAGVRGMPLGLHGLVGLPGGDAAEMPFGESLHLPALVVDGRGRMAGQRYPGLVMPADVGETLREIVGLPARLPATAEEPARPMSDLLDTWTHDDRDRVIGVVPGGMAVVTTHWFYLEEDVSDAEARRRLHAKPDDFFEVADVSSRCPEVMATLREIAAAARVGDRRAWTAPLGPAGEIA